MKINDTLNADFEVLYKELNNLLSKYPVINKIDMQKEDEDIKSFRLVLVDAPGMQSCLDIQKKVKQLYLDEVGDESLIPKKPFHNFALLLNPDKACVNYTITNKNMYKNVKTDKLIYEKYLDKEFSIHVNKLKHNARESLKLDIKMPKLTPSQKLNADNSILEAIHHDRILFEKIKESYDPKKEKFIGYELRYSDFPGKKRYSINFRYADATGTQKYLRDWLDEDYAATGVVSILWYEPIEFHNANYSIEKWLSSSKQVVGNIYFREKKMPEANRDIYIANRAFMTPRSVLSVDAIAETINKNSKTYYSGVIYITINHHNDNASIKIALNTYSARSLYFAIRELIQTKKSLFTKITGGNSQKAYTTLGFDDKYHYINIQRGNLKLSHSFDSYEIRAFIKSLELICDEVDKYLFILQQKINVH